MNRAAVNTFTQAGAAGVCFHCGEALPTVAPTAQIAGTVRQFCCHGCQAVALLIAGSGLENYYRFRTALAATAAVTKRLDWTFYDRPAVLEKVARRIEHGRREILLHLDGVRCAACAWLLQSLAARTAGIASLEVNPATARARVEFEPDRLPLSALLAEISRWGFKPTPELGGEILHAERRQARQALFRLAVAGIGMMQVLMYAVGLYFGSATGMPAAESDGFRWFSLVLSIPVLWFAGWPILAQAWHGLIARRPVMDQPVALALVLAWSASVWHTARGTGEVYFEAVTMFVFLLTLARFIEFGARRKAAASSRRLAEAAVVVAERRDPSGAWLSITADELEKDDRVRLKAESKVPADVVIDDGALAVDESLLTGESTPRHAGRGHYLLAGSRVVSGTAVARVAATGTESSLGRLRQILARAQSLRPRRQFFGDRLAASFIGLVLLLAFCTWLIWMQVEPSQAFDAALAVLVVTCPCALSLAAPAAAASAIGSLAQRGIFVANSDAMDKLAACDRVYFDKTGTLTDGRFRLLEVKTAPGLDRHHASALAALLLNDTRHPLASAFTDFNFAALSDCEVRVGDKKIVPGMGVTAEINGQRWYLGRAEFAGPNNSFALSDDTSVTELFLGNGSSVTASFKLTDRLRPNAADALHSLEALNIALGIISGDRPAAVGAVAKQLKIGDWHGGLLPDAKIAFVKKAQAQGDIVAMVGDGVNDAPVLSSADISIALAGGEAIAYAGADVIITAETLAQIPELVAHARRTRCIIRQNFVWAIAYNLIAAPAASLGLVAPWLAALGMALSSLLVIGNARRAARPAAIDPLRKHDVTADRLCLGVSAG